MTTFLLVRHGAHLLGGDTIAGRSPGVHLSPRGREQAGGVATRLAGLPIRAVYSSPAERSRETAIPLAERLGITLEVRERLHEIDFGDWTGLRLDELRPLPLFRQWNEFRSGVRIPHGETMPETQTRIVAEMLHLCQRHPDECIACFSHGDVIKAAVAHFMGVPLDLFKRIEIGLASVSAIAVGGGGPRIWCVNNTGEIALA